MLNEGALVRMVTIYDIAARANVSAMTVSRVINNAGRVSEKTRAKVKQVMEEMNYVPNAMARSLVLQETRILFLLVTDITNPFFTTLARGAEDAAKAYGFRLLFGNSDENVDKESEYIETILKTRVDGALIAPSGDPSRDNLAMLQRHRVPFVLLDREVPGIDADIVLGDTADGAQALVSHLVFQGHRRIALLNGSSSISSARQRMQGYREALAKHGLPFDERYVCEASFGLQRDLSAIENWLFSLDPMPTAIAAGNNVLALEAIRLLRSRGIRIPAELSLVCFDDFGPFAEAEPFVTVAAQQAYAFGCRGIELLVERIRERESAGAWRKIVLPAELIVRHSTAPPA